MAGVHPPDVPIIYTDDASGVSPLDWNDFVRYVLAMETVIENQRIEIENLKQRVSDLESP